MISRSLVARLREVPTLLRGEPVSIRSALECRSPGQILSYVLVIGIGAGAFGAAVGFWRAPVQALYTAVKLPLILLLTALGNGLLNGMLAPLLGLNITWRQSLVAVLVSFAIAAAILGGFSPVLLFLIWNTPAMNSLSTGTINAYSLVLVTQALVIAFAGIAANLRLVQLLRQMSSKWIAQKILFAWLTVNLLLGTQLSWNLRPFVGSPGLPVEFVRADAFNGNFFESLWYAMKNLSKTQPSSRSP